MENEKDEYRNSKIKIQGSLQQKKEASLLQKICHFNNPGKDTPGQAPDLD